MKKINSNLYIIILSFFAFFSCEDMMDYHKDYTKGGEIVYAPKVDSVIFSSGKRRIQFQYWLYDSPSVRSINVYWNNGKDSLEIPIERATIKESHILCDSGKVMIDNLQEGAYSFHVKTIDSSGNYSLKVEGFANSYGANYENGLSNRRVKSVSQYAINGNATIDWYAASEEMIGVEVKYTKKDNQEAIVSLSASSTSMVCPDAKTDSPFEYRTFFLPEPTAIDTFATDWSFNKTKFPFDRSNWEVIGVSDEQVSDGGGVKTIIDGIVHAQGIPSNFWHSRWSPVAPLPHWAVIDMKSPKKIAMIETFRRWSNNSTRSVEYYVGNEYIPGDMNVDFNKWTKITEGIFDSNASNNRLVLEVSDGLNVAGRYLLIYLRDSNNAQNTQISEIFVCGRSNE